LQKTAEIKTKFMKQSILVLATMSLSLFAFANNKVEQKIEKGNLNECTVTRSASSTVSGYDCDGQPFSVTSTNSCTTTSANCEEANAGAYSCAQLAAFRSAYEAGQEIQC
jgi:hypothetical protein